MEAVSSTDRLGRRYTELRVSGRVVSGTAMPYGEVADRGVFQETFVQGAFGPVNEIDATLNVMHEGTRLIARTGGGGLQFRDTAGGLLASAELPRTKDADDALTLINRGVLRGLSVEFRAVTDRIEGNLRRVVKATLQGLGIVDRPAYDGAGGLEVRVAGRVLRGLIPKGSRLGCKCQGPTCSAVTFADDAFDVSESVIAVNGSYGAPLASARRGGVRVKDTDRGLEVEIDVPDNEMGDGLLEMAQAVPVYVRPFLDNDLSEYDQTGDVRLFTKARVRAFIVGATDADEGQNAVQVTVPRRENRRILWPSL